MKISTEVDAMKIPLKPPMTNIETNAIALSMGTSKRSEPRHMVPIQLKVLIAEGTAINMVESIKVVPTVGFMPL